jgi:hypothetical protein
MAFNPDFFKVGIKNGQNGLDTTFNGWRVLSTNLTSPVNTSKQNRLACTTSRWVEYGNDLTNVVGRAESLSDTEGYIVSRAGGLSTTAGANTTPTFWRISDMFDDSTVVQRILELPYFTTMGNIPTGTTSGDRDDLVLQLYNAGFCFWMNHNRPPINETLRLNYEFDDSNCWASTGATAINDLENSYNGVINGTNPGWGNEDIVAFNSYPYLGTFPGNNNGYIAVNSAITIGSGVTFEFIAAASATTTTETIFDYAGNNFIKFEGGGTNGSVNWGGELVVNTGQQSARQHYVFSGRDNTDTSVVYANGVEKGTGTCNASMTSWTSGTRLFSTTSNSEKLQTGGYCGSFRVWNADMSTEQAQILYRHSQGKIESNYVL